MKALIIYRYYNPYKPHINGAEYRWSSFECAFKDDPNFTCEKLYLGDEPGFIKTAKQLNEALLTKEFDIAMVAEEFQYIVYLETAKKLGKKLFICGWDTPVATSTNCYVNFKISLKKSRVWGCLNQPVPVVDFVKYCNYLICDYGYGELHPNVYSICPPLDTNIFKVDETIEKDIDVVFCGSMYTEERHRYAKIFKDAGLNVRYEGGQNSGSQYLTEMDYANIFKRSKIVLVFSESVFGPNMKQRKGKLYEAAACGSFILMTHPEVLKSHKGAWFEEKTHFDTIDENNCVEKIKYYLEHEEERNSIAKAMHEHWQKTCSPRVWWEENFARLNDKDNV